MCKEAADVHPRLRCAEDVHDCKGDSMPVYLLTVHAYRSWSEGHSRGYVQHNDGLQPASSELACWREAQANHPPARFDRDAQRALIEVTLAIVQEKQLRAHASVATQTHVHVVVSFRSPNCTCGNPKNHCNRGCAARGFAEEVIVRMKRKMGQALAKMNGTSGRPYFSRGWDLTRVKDRQHFDFLIETYLPKHAEVENGVVEMYE